MDSSFAKGLSVLDLFQEGRISTHLDDVVAKLGTSRATAYRYLATLCDVGLLAPAQGGVYVLGPRIIELDRLMRISDPLLLAGSKVMQEVSEHWGLNMLLASYYRGRIMCIDIAWPDRTIPQHHERGLPISLFRGAMAKVILAHLSPYQLRNVALHHADEIRDAKLGGSWPEFRAHMADLARQGYAVTHAEMHPGSMGLSAPILDAEDKILGSITFSLSEAKWKKMDQEGLKVAIQDAAARIHALLAQGGLETASAAVRQTEDARTAPTPAHADRPARKTPVRRRIA